MQGMRRRIVTLLTLAVTIPAIAADKGTCPPMPPASATIPAKTSALPPSPSPEATYVGAVLLMAVISDKGYVCDAKVIRGLGKEIDRKAIASVREWHFEPARKGKVAVAVAITLEVDYWSKDGEIIQSPVKAPANATKDQGKP